MSFSALVFTLVRLKDPRLATIWGLFLASFAKAKSMNANAYGECLAVISLLQNAREKCNFGLIPYSGRSLSQLFIYKTTSRFVSKN